MSYLYRVINKGYIKYTNMNIRRNLSFVFASLMLLFITNFAYLVLSGQTGLTGSFIARRNDGVLDSLETDIFFYAVIFIMAITLVVVLINNGVKLSKITK